MTTTQRDTIPLPADGLVIYSSTLNKTQIRENEVGDFEFIPAAANNKIMAAGAIQKMMVTGVIQKVKGT